MPTVGFYGGGRGSYERGTPVRGQGGSYEKPGSRVLAGVDTVGLTTLISVHFLNFSLSLFLSLVCGAR
jgi:hypothetical protein